VSCSGIKNRDRDLDGSHLPPHTNGESRKD
jgi:hypothetical protein